MAEDIWEKSKYKVKVSLIDDSKPYDGKVDLLLLKNGDQSKPLKSETDITVKPGKPIERSFDVPEVEPNEATYKLSLLVKYGASKEKNQELADATVWPKTVEIHVKNHEDSEKDFKDVKLVVKQGGAEVAKPVTDKDGKTTSRVSAVYDAAPRQSFIAALKDVKEVWEVSYNPTAPDVAVGMVHDFKYREGYFVPGFLNPQRSQLDDYLDDFYFTQGYDEVMGASRNDAKAAVSGQVVNLDARKKIADLELPGMPHLGSGISWQWQGKTVMATPNLNEGLISIIDMQTWKTIKQIRTRGPGFFMRSHENSRYAWTDSMMSKEFKDTMQIIDKEKLEIVAELKPEPGKTFAHVEFTKDGKYVLASLWEMDGAIIVYDAATLKEVKRLPMKKPVGKYNVWNKINKSEGTSH